MCYSAQIWSDYRKYTRMFDAKLSIQDFVELFYWRVNDSSIKVPKGMEAGFDEPTSDQERRIRELIDQYVVDQAIKGERELFTQRKRLADAERVLAAKPTKAAAESKRIATDKISRAMTRLSDLKRTVFEDRDSRIFPGMYAPVMVMEDGQRVIKPMRYQCRPAGKPPFHDRKFPGTYNARRDNLEGFWKGLFGYSHGIMVVNAFYENVNRHRMERRELRPGEEVENVVLEFNPTPQQDMLVACLWSRWTAPGERELLSFAAITDEPPSEVAAAGHDRCIVPIKPENVDAWLNPSKDALAALYAILDNRARPYYEHRLAA